jgi:phosphatidylinositol-3-phosphatase
MALPGEAGWNPPTGGVSGGQWGDEAMSGAGWPIASRNVRFRRARLGRVAAVLVAGLPLAVAWPGGADASSPPIVLIVMENHSLSQIRSDPADLPYENALWSHSAPGVPTEDITSYKQTCFSSSGCTQGSMPNYEALVTGRMQQQTTGPKAGEDTDPSIFGQLNAAGMAWKAYAEGIPTPCSAKITYNDPVTDGRYGMGHTPAILVSDIWTNQANCKANVTGLPNLTGAALPQFTFLTPNYCDDMHGLPSGNPFTNCVTGSSALKQRSDSWLATVVPKLVADGATVLITYDEGGGSALFTVVAGAGVTNGTSFTTPTNHYGLLAGIETALGLSLLGNAATTPAVPVP